MTDATDVYVVAGTGPRRLQLASLPVKRAAVDAVAGRLSEVEAAVEGRLVVMSGMAEGFDACVALTTLRAGLRLWCAVPNRGYGAYYWGEHSVTGRDRRAEFDDILDRAWKVTYVMEDVHGRLGLRLDGEHANYVRNRWMVAQANEFVVWDPTTPGTEHCLAAVRAAGLPYVVLSDRVAAR